MKKIYQVLLATTLAVSAYGQTPIITMISDGDCSGGTPKVVELYAQGTVDFSLYSIEIQSNANTTWGSVESLASLGVITDAFVYLYRTADQAIFDVEFPSVVNTIGLAGSLNFNGDDRIRIVETATSTVIDQYGEEGVDGTGTAWEYVDGYAKRNNSTGPENPFVITNWTYGNGALNLLGVCQGGADPFETLIGTGTYTPLVVPTDPTILATPTSLAGFTQFVGTPSSEQTFEVSGTLLTVDITLTVTSGDYELSETSGGVFGPTITLTQTGGEVAATTIYVRLNGLLAASPSNGDVTLTSTGATDVVVTLEGQILNPAPTVFVSDTALTGFTHFVGTPSAEQTFEVSGSFLTDDIVITAPGEYEVSLTSGAGFGPSVTLIPTTGEVANTVIYVRLNGAAANPNQTGDVTIASAGVTDQTIALTGETFEYVLTTIGAATTIDADGVGESVGNLVELRGIVHCIDFRGGNGYNVTVVDGAGDGIQLFSFNQVAGYESAEGDSLQIFGTISQFNGLLQINAADIIVVSQGNPTATPDIVTSLGENTESQLVTLENLTFVTPITTFPTGNNNISVTDGTNTFTIRIDSDTDIPGAAAPQGPFNVIGVGGQFDNSSPYTSGYQLFPCGLMSFQPCVTMYYQDFDGDGFGDDSTGVEQCVQPANTVSIGGDCNDTDSTIYPGAMEVLDNNIDEDCDGVDGTLYLQENVVLETIISPNPSNGAFIIRFNISVNDGILNLTDINGKLILSKQITGLSYEINDITLKKGIYFLTITSSIGTARQRVIIN